jgi:glycerol-1-phosphatase
VSSSGPGVLRGTSQPLSRTFDLALLDLDGVVYTGREAVSGAVHGIAAARLNGMRQAFVTNNASRTVHQVAERLRRLGVPVTPDEVVTSAMAAASILASRLPEGGRVLVVGAEGLRQAVIERGLTPVSTVEEDPAAVVQGFGPEVGWHDLNAAARAVQSGLLWVAANTDKTIATPYGRSPGNGTLVDVVRTTTGAEPIVAGKPQPALFHETVARCAAQAPLVVGDRLDTDIEGAHHADIPALLVLTGVTDVLDLLSAPAQHRPHFIGSSLHALNEPHPIPQRHAGATGDTWQCRDAVVEDQDGTLHVRRVGDDPLDLLRAACEAVWADTERIRNPQVNARQSLSATRRGQESPQNGYGASDREGQRRRARTVLAALESLDSTTLWEGRKPPGTFAGDSGPRGGPG